jgi:hypothetical protein
MSQIICGNVIETGKEYFRVKLTTKQTNGTDTGHLLVNFASNGTVVYDTLSNWDSSTNSYKFGSSDGVYLIHFSVGLSSPTTTTETLRDVASYVTFSSDNFSSLLDTPAFGAGGRPVDQSNLDIGGVTLSNSSIFKATATDIKIRLTAWVNTDGGAWTIAKDVNETTGSNESELVPVDATFLEIVRIT